MEDTLPQGTKERRLLRCLTESIQEIDYSVNVKSERELLVVLNRPFTIMM